VKSATTTPTATSSIIKSESIILLTLAPHHKDYMFHLDKNEGTSDLFDFDVSNK
jgi:hypothetical protein